MRGAAIRGASTVVVGAFLILALGAGPAAPPPGWAEEEIEGDAGSVEAAEEMRRAPIDINAAGAAELMRLPGVGPSIAARWLRVRREGGPFRSAEDLVRRGILTPEHFEAIGDRLTSGPAGAPDVIEIRSRAKGRWGADGARWGNGVRVRWAHGDAWSAGLLTDRDPGERRAVDLWKAGLRYRAAAGRLESLTVGSLRCEFARGLLFFSRSRIDPGSLLPGTTGRVGRGVGIDLSSTEGYDLRGAAAGIRPSSRLLVTALVSRTRLDVSRGEDGRVVAIRRSGDRSSMARVDRGALRLLSAAVRTDLRLGDAGRIGGTLARFCYSEPIDPPRNAENTRAFRGRRALFIAVDGDAAVGAAGFFWEVAADPARGAGGLAGLESGRGPTRWSLLFRHYGAGFAPPFGNPFQDGDGSPSNESGLFTSLGWRPRPGLRLAVRIDTLDRPWPRGREPFPAGRREVAIDARWRPLPGVEVQTRLLDRRGETVGTGSGPSRLEAFSLRRLRLQIDWRDPPLAFRVRAEGAFSGRGSGGPGRGALLYLQSRIRRSRTLTFDLRLALFGSGAAAADVYAWEPDLPGAMRIFRGSGEGMRAAIVGRVRATDLLTLTMKWGMTRRFPAEGRTASGASGVAQPEVGLQVDYGAGG